MLNKLVLFSRNIVCWMALAGILCMGNLHIWGTQVSDQLVNSSVTVEQTMGDHSVSPCNGQCVVDSMLCNANACVSANPTKIVLVRKAWSVNWPILTLTLAGQAISIEPKPPKYA